nr:replication initiator [Nocardia otitidiscaviarum]
MTREVAMAAADTFGVCRRPLAMRVQEADGSERIIGSPCKSTVASVCPACARRAWSLRFQQCREGWHAETEPVDEKREPTPVQVELLTARADLTEQYRRDVEAGDGEAAAVVRDIVAQLDTDLRASGVRGRLPALDAAPKLRATRSTRRRQDTPNLPRRKVARTTVGGVHAGRRYSMFVTLTLPSYGPVRSDGSPWHVEGYDYRRAARDIVFFAALFDRWIQNLRRAVGYDVQYFATVEPQRRGAPHIHVALRTSIPRKVLRMVTEATYRQIWWPHFDHPAYDDDHMPVWDYQRGTFVDPDTGEPLPDWEQAQEVLDSVDELEPAHVIRFGAQMDIKGIPAGSEEANRHIGYLTKYLVKSIGEVLEATSMRAAEHYRRLHEELQTVPCSPRCPVWLRYGIVPQGVTERTVPGRCKGKAHRRETLGLRGQRVLVSRRWSGKTLPDHQADRTEFVRQVLAAAGIAKTDPRTAVITPVRPGDPGVPPREHLILAALAQRSAWRSEYRDALEALGPPGGHDISATPTAA